MDSPLTRRKAILSRTCTRSKYKKLGIKPYEWKTRRKRNKQKIDFVNSETKSSTSENSEKDEIVLLNDITESDFQPITTEESLEKEDSNELDNEFTPDRFYTKSSSSVKRMSVLDVSKLEDVPITRTVSTYLKEVNTTRHRYYLSGESPLQWIRDSNEHHNVLTRQDSLRYQAEESQNR